MIFKDLQFPTKLQKQINSLKKTTTHCRYNQWINMKSRTIINKILEIDLNLSKSKLIEEILKIQDLAKKELEISDKRNRDSYQTDIKKSRLERKRNNSRQAIKKLFPQRHSSALWCGKTKKQLILNHIKTLRTVSSSQIFVKTV